MKISQIEHKIWQVTSYQLVLFINQMKKKIQVKNRSYQFLRYQLGVQEIKKLILNNLTTYMKIWDIIQVTLQQLAFIIPLSKLILLIENGYYFISTEFSPIQSSAGFCSTLNIHIFQKHLQMQKSEKLPPFICPQ